MGETVLVGNGAALLGSDLGPAIDAHERIVRFNRYHLLGHERDVGSRVTVWAVGVWRGALAVLQAQGAPPGSDTVDQVWAATVAGRSARNTPEWREYSEFLPQPYSAVAVTYELLGIPLVRELKAAGCIAALRWPSTGLLMLAYCLRARPDEVPAVCGFWGRPGIYANPGGCAPGREHDFSLERVLIETWIKEGRVWVCGA